MRQPTPVLKVSLELQQSLLGDGSELPLRQCEFAIASLADTLLQALGVPGCTAVSASVGALPGHRVLRLTVDGEPCRYPDEILNWTASYVTGSPPLPDVSIADTWARIATAAHSSGDGSDRTVVDLVTHTCMEILKCNVPMLLGDEQVDAYAAGLEAPLRLAAARDVWPPSASWLGPVLRDVLTLRVGIADRRAVATVLADAESVDDPRGIVEELAANLGPKRLEIRCAPDLLDRLTSGETASVREVFSFLREGLFLETGVSYPAFHIRIADDLKPGTFAFQIGSLQTTPLFALTADEHLVNDTQARLEAENIESRPALNPATAQPAAIVSRDKLALLGSERTTWDFRGHLILCMAAALRQHGWCFVDRNLTRERLHFMGQVFPAIGASLTAAGYTDARVTRILRSLVAEEISIRNLRRILELLIQNRQWQGDDRVLLDRVRRGMSRAIRDKYARGTDTLVVYLLDPRIEDMVSAPKRRPTEEAWDAILWAVRAELASLPPTAQRPALLTTALARPIVREVVASEFPRLSVICYEELPGNATVQPVARIGLAPAGATPG